MSDGAAFVAYDDRDIRFNIPYGFLPYGVGLAGSNGLAPQITGTGSATLGSDVSLEITDGPVGAGGVLLIGASGGKASTPLFLGQGELLVTPAWQVPVVLDDLSPTGAGALSIAVTIPDYAAFLGVDLYFQVALVDPGAPFGLALSNGLELWIG